MLDSEAASRVINALELIEDLTLAEQQLLKLQLSMYEAEVLLYVAPIKHIQVLRPSQNPNGKDF